MVRDPRLVSLVTELLTSCTPGGIIDCHDALGEQKEWSPFHKEIDELDELLNLSEEELHENLVTLAEKWCEQSSELRDKLYKLKHLYQKNSDIGPKIEKALLHLEKKPMLLLGSEGAFLSDVNDKTDGRWNPVVLDARNHFRPIVLSEQSDRDDWISRIKSDNISLIVLVGPPNRDAISERNPRLWNILRTLDDAIPEGTDSPAQDLDRVIFAIIAEKVVLENWKGKLGIRDADRLFLLDKDVRDAQQERRLRQRLGLSTKPESKGPIKIGERTKDKSVSPVPTLHDLAVILGAPLEKKINLDEFAKLKKIVENDRRFVLIDPGWARPGIKVDADARFITKIKKVRNPLLVQQWDDYVAEAKPDLSLYLSHTKSTLTEHEKKELARCPTSCAVWVSRESCEDPVWKEKSIFGKAQDLFTELNQSLVPMPGVAARARLAALQISSEAIDDEGLRFTHLDRSKQLLADLVELRGQNVQLLNIFEYTDSELVDWINTRFDKNNVNVFATVDFDNVDLESVDNSASILTRRLIDAFTYSNYPGGHLAFKKSTICIYFLSAAQNQGVRPNELGPEELTWCKIRFNSSNDYRPVNSDVEWAKKRARSIQHALQREAGDAQQ
jgi:hypothetical protein